jgi:hypothetical protein
MNTRTFSIVDVWMSFFLSRNETMSSKKQTNSAGEGHDLIGMKYDMRNPENIPNVIEQNVPTDTLFLGLAGL